MNGALAGALSLRPGVLHLLWFRWERPPVPLAELERCLTDGERLAAARFRQRSDRDRHVAARGMLRRLLGSTMGVGPQAVALVQSVGGKPELPGGPSFSVSHSGAVVLLGLAESGRVGVDVETVRQLVDLAGLARSVFSPRELAEFRALSEAEQERAFHRAWARKEALLKALGTGLGGGTANFTVSLEAGFGPVLRQAPVGEQASRWTLRSISCDPSVEAAVAWDRPAAALHWLS